MSDQPYFRFFVANWLGGTRGMRAGEIGVYITLIALMYDRGSPIQEDARRLARQCGCTPKTFLDTLEMLVDDGKIERTECGLWNKRVEKEFKWRAENSHHSRAAAKKRWQKTNKNNAPIMPEQCDRNADAMPYKNPEPYSVPNGTGEIAEFPDQRKQVFDTALPSLKAQGHDERAARSIIGRWRKQCGNDDAYLLGKLAAAGKAQPANLIEWMAKAVPKTSGGFGAALDAMDEDLRP